MTRSVRRSIVVVLAAALSAAFALVPATSANAAVTESVSFRNLVALRAGSAAIVHAVVTCPTKFQIIYEFNVRQPRPHAASRTANGFIQGGQCTGRPQVVTAIAGVTYPPADAGFPTNSIPLVPGPAIAQAFSYYCTDTACFDQYFPKVHVTLVDTAAFDQPSTADQRLVATDKLVANGAAADVYLRYRCPIGMTNLWFGAEILQRVRPMFVEDATLNVGGPLPPCTGGWQRTRTTVLANTRALVPGPAFVQTTGFDGVSPMWSVVTLQ
jgi:hypothetical protein